MPDTWVAEYCREFWRLYDLWLPLRNDRNKYIESCQAWMGLWKHIETCTECKREKK